jgi:hypothetical protein
MSILEYLSEIPDSRRKQGQRYPLDKMLCLVLLGTLAGRVGYRAISRFGKEHEAYISKILGLKHGTPSHVSLTSIIDNIDFEDFQKAVNKWSMSKYGESSETGKGTKKLIALDGKSIKSSVEKGQSSKQNFVAFVNAFCLDQEHIVGAMAYENGKGSEIEVVRDLIKELGIKEAVFTLDANHESKKP